MEVLNEEIRQTSASSLPFYNLGFISKNGFSAKEKYTGRITYTLEDFYASNLETI